MIQAVFVYGTLKRGECRAPLWPAHPISIDEGWTRGTLYTRDDYPAMMTGENRVLGELWRFSADDMNRVILALDKIEGTNQPNQPDLYVRATVETWNLDNEPLDSAFAYRYATDPTADGFVRMRPGNGDFVCWPET